MTRLRAYLFQPARMVRWALVIGVLGACELATRHGVIGPLVMPPPTEIANVLPDILSGPEFRDDLQRTLYELVAAYGLACAVGVTLGVACWRVRIVGDSLEPYLVTFYAIPIIVFYPILLATLGLGSAPIIVLAGAASSIPIALSTMVALRSTSPILEKLGRSINCSRRQLYQKILVPAAAPLAVAGLRLGLIYAFIGVVAMELVVSSLGIGYRIGVYYQSFAIPEMWAMITIVSAMAVVTTSLLAAGERRIRKDML